MNELPNSIHGIHNNDLQFLSFFYFQYKTVSSDPFVYHFLLFNFLIRRDLES